MLYPLAKELGLCLISFFHQISFKLLISCLFFLSECKLIVLLVVKQRREYTSEHTCQQKAATSVQTSAAIFTITVTERTSREWMKTDECSLNLLWKSF